MSKYGLKDGDLKELETAIDQWANGKKRGAHDGYQWKFAGAFYFAITLITTVGYGHSTPATKEGKLFCMAFALCGIPLSLVMFQSIGERLNTLIAYLLTKFLKILHPRNKSRIVRQSYLILISSSVGGLIICLGTYVFHKVENWNLFEAYYFCMITLTTIGFGDYVALRQNGHLQRTPVYVVFTLFFVLFGLAVFSANINLLVLRFMATNVDETSGSNNAGAANKRLVQLEPIDIPRTGTATTHRNTLSSSDTGEELAEEESILYTSTSTCTPTTTTKDYCGYCWQRRGVRKPSDKVSFAVRRSPLPNAARLIHNESPTSTVIG